MNLILISPPGAGKKSLSGKLEKKYNLMHFSTGSILREEIEKQSIIGKKVKKLTDLGKFVEDNLMKQLVVRALNGIEDSNGIVFDGYPRNLKQVKDLDEILSKLNKKLDYVFYLKIDKETSRKRALGRQKCPICDKHYNKNTGYKTPKIEGICDICNSKLISRVDDTEEVFNERYKIYQQMTEPIIKYYSDRQLLFTIDATLLPDEIMSEVEKYLNKKRK